MNGLKKQDNLVSWIIYTIVFQSFCSSLIESDKLWDTELMATAYVQYLKAREKFFFFTEEQNQGNRKQKE